MDMANAWITSHTTLQKDSDENDANLVRGDRLNAPIVEVVGQLAIAGLENEVALELAVLEDLGHVEHIEVVHLCKD